MSIPGVRNTPILSGELTIAVGDVHGQLDQLKALMAAINERFSSFKLNFVFLGDYIDRGPDSKGVIDYIRAMPDTIALVGNHETMLMEAYYGTPMYRHQWDRHYGIITTDSFGVKQCEDIPLSYILWMKSLPYYYNDGKRTFVHAGIQRGRRLSMVTQDKSYMTWARFEFLNDLSTEGGFVVHGHTPIMRGPDLHENRVNVDTGSCFGGVLSAVIFCDSVIKPTHYIKHTGEFGAF